MRLNELASSPISSCEDVTTGCDVVPVRAISRVAAVSSRIGRPSRSAMNVASASPTMSTAASVTISRRCSWRTGAIASPIGCTASVTSPRRDSTGA